MLAADALSYCYLEKILWESEIMIMFEIKDTYQPVWSRLILFEPPHDKTNQRTIGPVSLTWLLRIC